jgi:hypothetical protein
MTPLYYDAIRHALILLTTSTVTPTAVIIDAAMKDRDRRRHAMISRSPCRDGQDGPEDMKMREGSEQ